MAALPNCIICYEAFPDWHALSALACGHVFHYKCVADWARQCEEKGNSSTCPSCLTRFEMSEARGIVRRLFFTFEDEAEVARRTRELSELQFKLTLTETMLKSANEQLEVVQKREADMHQAQEEKKRHKEKLLRKRLEEWKKGREEMLQKKECDHQNSLEREEKTRTRSESYVTSNSKKGSTDAVVEPPHSLDITLDSPLSIDSCLRSDAAGVNASRGPAVSRDETVSDEINGPDSLDGATGGMAEIAEIAVSTSSVSILSPDSPQSSQFSSCFSSPITPSDMTSFSPKTSSSPRETKSAFKPYGFTTPTSPIFCFASLTSNADNSPTKAAASSSATTLAAPVFSSALNCFRFSAPTDDSKTVAEVEKKMISSQNALFSFGRKPADNLFNASTESVDERQNDFEGAAADPDNGLKVRTLPSIAGTGSSPFRFPVTAISSLNLAPEKGKPFLPKSPPLSGITRLAAVPPVINQFGNAISTAAAAAENTSFRFTFPASSTFASSAPIASFSVASFPGTPTIGATASSRSSSVPIFSSGNPCPSPSFTPLPASTSSVGIITSSTLNGPKYVGPPTRRHASLVRFGGSCTSSPVFDMSTLTTAATTRLENKPLFVPFLAADTASFKSAFTVAAKTTSHNPTAATSLASSEEKGCLKSLPSSIGLVPSLTTSMSSATTLTTAVSSGVTSAMMALASTTPVVSTSFVAATESPEILSISAVATTISLSGPIMSTRVASTPAAPSFSALFGTTTATPASTSSTSLSSNDLTTSSTKRSHMSALSPLAAWPSLTTSAGTLTTPSTSFAFSALSGTHSVPSHTSPSLSTPTSVRSRSRSSRTTSASSTTTSTMTTTAVSASAFGPPVFDFPSAPNARNFWTAAKVINPPSNDETLRAAGKKPANVKRITIRKGRRRRGAELGIALPPASVDFGEAIKNPLASIERENLDGEDANDSDDREGDDTVELSADNSLSDI